MSESIFNMFATKEGACWQRIKLWVLLCGCDSSSDEEFDLGESFHRCIVCVCVCVCVCVRVCVSDCDCAQ